MADGWLDRCLSSVHVLKEDFHWLIGKWLTVVNVKEANRYFLCRKVVCLPKHCKPDGRDDVRTRAHNAEDTAYASGVQAVQTGALVVVSLSLKEDRGEIPLPRLRDRNDTYPGMRL